MSHSLLVALIAFGAVMAFTPGPNNIMVLSSGLTYGFRRTVPHMAGVAFGIAFMVAAMGLGFGAIFFTWPILQTILKYAGIAYLIYLAWAIAMSGPVTPGQDNQAAPLTFWGAVLFQWVNVKGWVMAIGIITAYSAVASFPWNIAVQAALMFIMGALSSVLWALFGSSLRPVLTSAKAVRAFNVVMALLLLASLYPVLVDA